MTLKQKTLFAVAAMAIGSPVSAQVDELPAYAYDMLAEVTIATTADAKCDGIAARPKKVEARIVAMYQQLVKDGISINDAVQHLQTEFAIAEVAKRETSLREKHGVAAEGDSALCEAIRAEAKQNRDIAKLMRIR